MPLAERPSYRDRNDHYVPAGLYLDGRPQLTEIKNAYEGISREAADQLLNAAESIMGDLVLYASGDPDVAPSRLDDARRWAAMYRENLLRTRVATTARIAHASADEQNRDHGTWWWVDVSGDGTHWSHFRGHRVQVDVALHTSNRREVNEWKGRDEIRAEGTWTLALNRQQIWEGNFGSDVFYALRELDRVTRALLDHVAIDWYDQKPVAEQLGGRRVYFDRCPAVVSYVSTLHQGCVGLKPVGVDRFPPSLYELDRNEDADPYERDEIKVDLLDPHIHWWRDRLVEGVERPSDVKGPSA